MTALIDTNVVLDLLLKREPFLSSAATIFAAIEKGACGGAVCATTITDIYYIARRQIGGPSAKQRIRDLTRLLKIVEVNSEIVIEALSSEMKDFENSILHEAAIASRLDCIVTRNKSDFTPSSIPIYTPEQFLPILSVLDKQN